MRETSSADRGALPLPLPLQFLVAWIAIVVGGVSDLSCPSRANASIGSFHLGRPIFGGPFENTSLTITASGTIRDSQTCC